MATEKSVLMDGFLQGGASEQTDYLVLGSGIAEPDVIEVNLDQQETVANAVAQIDRRRLPLQRVQIHPVADDLPGGGGQPVAEEVAAAQLGGAQL